MMDREDLTARSLRSRSWSVLTNVRENFFSSLLESLSSSSLSVEMRSDEPPPPLPSLPLPTFAEEDDDADDLDEPNPPPPTGLAFFFACSVVPLCDLGGCNIGIGDNDDIVGNNEGTNASVRTMTVTDAAPIVKRQNNGTVDNTSVNIIVFIIMLLMWRYCVCSVR